MKHRLGARGPRPEREKRRTMGVNRYFVGVDVGQVQDFTAIAVLERAELVGGFDPAMYAYRKEVALRLRYLERVPLGTPYSEIVERVEQVVRWGELAGNCHLAVDATGVGRPVIELLRPLRLGCRLLPVIFTGGDSENVNEGFYRVPKRDLVTGLQILLQNGGLQIAAGMEHGRTLVEELTAVRVRVMPSGREQYGAWREGTHDDMVFAVALACWAAKKMEPRGAEKYWRRDDAMVREWERGLRSALGK